MALSIPERLQASQEDIEAGDKIDEVLDQLSAGVRGQVLQELNPRQQPEHKPWSPLKRFMWWTGVTFTLLWSVPWVLVTVVLFCTILLAPLGALTWAIGCAPVSKLIENKIKAPTERPWKRL